MLKMQFIGILGRDAEVKEFGDSKAINLTVAVNKEYKNSDGEKIEKTDWIKCVLWKNGKQSTKVVDFLKKGKRVFIEGEPSAEAYLSKDGEAKGQLSLTIRDLELLN